MRLRRVCVAPGCSTLVVRGRCPAHAYRAALAWDSASGRVRGRRWMRLRLSVLADDLLCRDGRVCGGRAPSTEVDHVVPLEAGGDPLERSNLQGICADCHRAKSKAERQEAGR